MSAIDNHIREAAQRELAARVLKQAEHDLRRFHSANSSIERELYRDAYSWVISDECTWPFSFLNVCQLLNLSSEDIRHELLGDLSLGPLSRWSRHCVRVARRLQLPFSQFIASERTEEPTEQVNLFHTSH